MNKLWFVIIMIASCKNITKQSQPILTKPIQEKISDSFVISIKAVNLSEDFSPLSTKDDELLLVVFNIEQDSTFGNAVLKEYFVADSNNREFHFKYKNPKTPNCSVWLIEMDTERDSNEVITIVKKHQKELLKAYSNKNYK